MMWNSYYNVTTIQDAVNLLAEQDETARIVAGGTDLIIEMERGVRKGITTLIDVSRIPGLNQVSLDEDGVIHLGALVTHNQAAASKLVVEGGFPLARAAWEVGAPQIRNRGTIAGNVITASPANDTITPLMALGASVSLRSRSGERCIPLEAFYTGVRKTVMRPDEMLVEISFPALRPNQRGAFMKVGLRRAQAISLVNIAVVLTFTGDPAEQRSGVSALPIEKAEITLGAVAPTILHAAEAESFLAGKTLSPETIATAAELVKKAATPIDDVRSSKDYRLEAVRVAAARSLKALAEGEERAGYPKRPVLLNGQGENGYRQAGLTGQTPIHHWKGEPIVTRINGKPYTFTSGQHKTLLRLLREEGGLIGTKEGCAEGECGACTVFLDGAAVMACLVPAPRAHGAEIVTVEGLAQDGKLHPVQQAFIDEGAVQCGYCTPGFLMSAAKLLEELPKPSRDEIKQAITGNLCRCTGYYKIVQAIELASQKEGSHG